MALLDGVPITGGAFRRYDSTTAELERVAARRGYTRIYRTTGWRQPEAVARYLARCITSTQETGRRPGETEFRIYASSRKPTFKVT